LIVSHLKNAARDILFINANLKTLAGTSGAGCHFYESLLLVKAEIGDFEVFRGDPILLCERRPVWRVAHMERSRVRGLPDLATRLAGR
jgi:hypothetical protein